MVTTLKDATSVSPTLHTSAKTNREQIQASTVPGERAKIRPKGRETKNDTSPLNGNNMITFRGRLSTILFTLAAAGFWMRGMRGSTSQLASLQENIKSGTGIEIQRAVNSSVLDATNFFDSIETSAPVVEETKLQSKGKEQVYNEIRQVQEQQEQMIRDGSSLKYIQYFAQSGWSNQVKCLKQTYYIARALNLTIILPPMLPHMGKGSTNHGNVMPDRIAPRFRTDVDLSEFYHPARVTSGSRGARKKRKSTIETGASQTKTKALFKYLRMDQLLDVEFSLPGIPGTMDHQDFVNQRSTSASNGKKKKKKDGMMDQYSWVMETTYTHFNTRWIYQRPDLDGNFQVRESSEYGRPVVYNQSHREIVPTIVHAVSMANKIDKKSNIDTITFLDAFKASFHESATTPSMPMTSSKNGTSTGLSRKPGDAQLEGEIEKSFFQPRYSTLIRQTARNILPYLFRPAANVSSFLHVNGSLNSNDRNKAKQSSRNLFDNEEGNYIDHFNHLHFPYASIHIRGGDGGFSKNGRIETSIATAVEKITTVIVDWIQSSSSSLSASPLLDGVDTEQDTPIHQVIGLFVASDLRGLRDNDTMKQALQKLQQRLGSIDIGSAPSSTPKKIKYQLQVEFGNVLWNKYHGATVKGNDETAKHVPEQLEILSEELGSSAGLILDQQLAACADIGFVGTKGSTFSSLINLLRQSRIEACYL